MHAYNKCPTTSAPPPETYDGYRWRYIAVWSVGWVALGGAIALLVLGILWSVPHRGSDHAMDPLTNSTQDQHPEGAAIAFPGMALCLVLFALMYRDAARLRYRSGSGLLGGLFGERSSLGPTTLKAARADCQKARMKGDMLTPVGSAWSNALAQRTTRGRRLYLTGMQGLVQDGTGRTWLAGTTLKTVQDSLAEEGLQLIGVPSSSYVTLGAWVATMAHGNSGPETTHGMIAVSASVVDQKTGIEIADVNPERLLDMFGQGSKRAKQFVVLTVTIDETVIKENMRLLRQGRRVSTLDDAEWALGKDTVMRAIFIGTTKTLALRWTEYREITDKPESILLKVWLFVFAGLGWGWAMPNYEDNDSSGKLSEEVYLFPDSLTPPQLYFQMILNIVNYEVYTSDIELTADKLLKITQTLNELHSAHGGRTELRTLGKLVYFDMAMWASPTAFRASFAALLALGVKKCAQHPGKYLHSEYDLACGGVKLVTPYEVETGNAPPVPLLL